MPCSSCNSADATPGRDGLDRRARRGVMRLALPTPTVDKVVKYMGLPGESAGDADLAHTIKAALQLVEPLLQPVAIWCIADLASMEAESITLTGADGRDTRLPCTSSFFRGASHVHLSLITLGPRLEELLVGLFAEDPLTAMACDAAGSATLAAAGAMFFNRRQMSLAKCGLHMPIMYVPGCQALPLEAQKGIFALLQPETIGVQLSDACLMSPAKSATSVAPVGSALPGWMEKLSPCQLCSLRKTCNFKATKDPGA